MNEYQAAQEFSDFLAENKVILSPWRWWSWFIRNPEAWPTIRWWIQRLREKSQTARIMIARRHDPECSWWDVGVLIHAKDNAEYREMWDYIEELGDSSDYYELDSIFDDFNVVCLVDNREEPWNQYRGILFT